ELIRQRRDSQKVQAAVGAQQGELHQEGRPASKADDVQSAKQLAEEAEKQVKRQDVIDQIVKHIEVKSLQNQTEVAIKLNPEFLGQLKVKLEFKDGGVSASFDTTSALVREMLDESKDELMETFSGKGIKLSHISVRTVTEEEMA
ncbi:MAG: flagellar hook-length control protein FliK, partial [Chloroflexi bacterium]|nr:flagellar hook-length control protein FliK [Chloroflexota bacterium]